MATAITSGDEAGASGDADESDDVGDGYSRGGEVAHAKGVEVSVDNTFLSPYLQRPIELGADIVMHSTTKFLNGHSDGLGGVLVGTKPEHAERFRFVQKCTGGILSPFDSYLLLRGVKTLAVRMKQHDANGRVVADWLVKKLGPEARVLSGAEDASAARAGEAAAEGLWLDAVV